MMLSDEWIDQIAIPKGKNIKLSPESATILEARKSPISMENAKKLIKDKKVETKVTGGDNTLIIIGLISLGVAGYFYFKGGK